MKKYYLPLIAIMCLLSACGDPIDLLISGNQFDETINGKRIDISKNQQFTIALDVFADGGYSWDYTISGASVIKLDSLNYKPKDRIIRDGGAMIETFYFTAMEKGECNVNMIHHRIWETNVDPINSIQFNVSVR